MSAYTQVKMEDAPSLLRNPKSECPDIWIRVPKHKWPKSWSSMEYPVVLLERNLHDHFLGGLLWEREFEKVLLEHGWEKVPNWECLFVYLEKGLSLSVYVDDTKLVGKKHDIDPMWKVLMEQVDLGEPTSFLDHVNLGCTQHRSAKRAKILSTTTEMCLNLGSPQEQKEKLPSSGRHDANISTWSYDVEGHAQKMCGAILRAADKTTQQLYKVETPCLDDHQFKEEELGSVGESSKVCSQIVLQCLYLARIGKPDILWSVNKLARQTFSEFDLLRTPHKSIRAILSCGKYRTTTQIGSVSGLGLCRRS